MLDRTYCQQEIWKLEQFLFWEIDWKIKPSFTVKKIITPYGVKMGWLCKKSKILLEMELNLLKVE